MGCKKRVIRFGKWAWRVLGRSVSAQIPKVVEALEFVEQSLPGMLSGHDKRKIVLDAVKAKAKEIGHDAYNDAKDLTEAQLLAAARAAIENALFHLREGVAAEEIGDPSDEETAETV